MSDIVKLVLGIALIAAIVIFGPIITIWCLNALFPVLAIPLDITTWFATLWLFSFVAFKGKK